ncbi:MAG: type IV secretion system DNA-binding domain-containing protein [Candidatus Zambryskibacteria bacterium]|nr:type IV secretion system DNA-binding domain-containing protein [Candidatus Zambryskibacteria bacterium]
MDQNTVTYFAETDARNKKIKFGIKAKDRLKHMYVIGKTGMGKSTLLENMAIQDIQNGNGIAFIDPHGGSAEKLLDYIPENRIKDVLYFAPFDLDYPVSFNIMEDVGANKRHLVVAGLMATFEKIWADAWSARMAYILQNTLLALLEYPGATLLGVNRMYTDKDFRKSVVDNITDVTVKSFWVDEYTKYTDRYTQEATPAIQNKIGQFASNPLIRNIIGQSKSTFDLRKIMDEKKILIMNLSKGLVGEGNAKLLGSMLITKIYLAAMSRADLHESELAKSPNFYFYVDEFQSFANKSFADILSEARKYRLNLTIAHQYIEQMEEEVRDAVFGNVGTLITFRVGAFDAEVLEKEFAPTFTAEDLVNLGFAQIYLKLMIDGVSSPPFSATTLPSIDRPKINFKNDVIKSSREQFSHTREIVEKNILDWHGTEKSQSPAAPTRPFVQNRPEVRNESRQNFAKQNFGGQARHEQEHMRPPPSHKATDGQVKIDENKKAFIKAAEVLAKSVSNETDRPTQIKSEFRGQSEALKNSQISDGKNPTKENISGLKEALASVIKNTEKKSENGAENAKATSARLPAPDAAGNGGQASGREVPEQVLRDLLKMEEGK